MKKEALSPIAQQAANIMDARYVQSMIDAALDIQRKEIEREFIETFRHKYLFQEIVTESLIKTVKRIMRKKRVR